MVKGKRSTSAAIKNTECSGMIPAAVRSLFGAGDDAIKARCDYRKKKGSTWRPTPQPTLNQQRPGVSSRFQLSLVFSGWEMTG